MCLVRLNCLSVPMSIIFQVLSVLVTAVIPGSRRSTLHSYRKWLHPTLTKARQATQNDERSKSRWERLSPCERPGHLKHLFISFSCRRRNRQKWWLGFFWPWCTGSFFADMRYKGLSPVKALFSRRSFETKMSFPSYFGGALVTIIQQVHDNL